MNNTDIKLIILCVFFKPKASSDIKEELMVAAETKFLPCMEIHHFGWNA